MSSIGEFEKEPHNSPAQNSKPDSCEAMLLPTTELFYAQVAFACEPNFVRMNDLDKAERKYSASFREVVHEMADGWNAMGEICNLVHAERYVRREALIQSLAMRTLSIYKTRESRWSFLRRELGNQGNEASIALARVLENADEDEADRWDRYELSSGYQRREVSAAMERLELDMGFERRIFDNAVLPKKGHLALLNRGARLLDGQPRQSS